VTKAVLVTFLATLCLAAPAQAAKPIVGFGEQSVFMFSDPRWKDLDKPYTRYVMPWDALKYQKSRAQVDFYMQGAEAVRAKVLLSFGYSAKKKRQFKMPTPRQFRAQIKAVRKRYPFIKTFQTWNEANQGFQPTFRKPKATGKLYDTLVKTCKGCTVTSPSLLLAADMNAVNWAKAFDRAAKKRVKIWAVHNHIDVNRNIKTGTKNFLRHTRGQVWFTETGAIWNRWIGRRKLKQYNHKTAVRAIRNIFKLQKLSKRRIKRIYVYNWYGTKAKRPRWDSGLFNHSGTERKTFKTLKAQLRKYAR
jgi:polysaccharide biosynthesis protein PslG